jgi:hypothetical protein
MKDFFYFEINFNKIELPYIAESDFLLIFNFNFKSFQLCIKSGSYINIAVLLRVMLLSGLILLCFGV